jgi:hypothetical protein
MLWVQKLKEAASLTIDKKYELKEVLGQGAFAKVKRGIEKTSGKNFAIKIIEKEKMSENRESIMTEITILKNISHPNIMKLHHVFETKNKIYLVLDLLNGGELFDMISERINLSERESSRLIRKVIQSVKIRRASTGPPIVSYSENLHSPLARSRSPDPGNLRSPSVDSRYLRSPSPADSRHLRSPSPECDSRDIELEQTKKRNTLAPPSPSSLTFERIRQMI